MSASHGGHIRISGNMENIWINLLFLCSHPNTPHRSTHGHKPTHVQFYPANVRISFFFWSMVFKTFSAAEPLNSKEIFTDTPTHKIEKGNKWFPRVFKSPLFDGETKLQSFLIFLRTHESCPQSLVWNRALRSLWWGGQCVLSVPKPERDDAGGLPREPRGHCGC